MPVAYTFSASLLPVDLKAFSAWASKFWKTDATERSTPWKGALSSIDPRNVDSILPLVLIRTRPSCRVGCHVLRVHPPHCVHASYLGNRHGKTMTLRGKDVPLAALSPGPRSPEGLPRQKLQHHPLCQKLQLQSLCHAPSHPLALWH